MTSRFRIALSALALCAAAVLLIALFTGLFDGGAGGPGDLDVGEGGPGGFTPEGELELDGPGGGLAPNPNAAAPGGNSGSLVNSRTPSGLDLTDPEQRNEYLMQLIGEYDTNWDEIARVLRVSADPIPDEVRAFLIDELKSGRKLGVLKVFAVILDPTMTRDLIDVLDMPGLSSRVERVALQALYTMPGANSSEVVRELESRLTDDMSRDNRFLHAIASRGGPEAARALVEYLQRSQEPGEVPQFVLRALDLEGDPETAEIVKQALATEDLDPEVRNRLMLLVSRPGATEFVPMVIALDADGQSQKTRERALETLARIGGKDAITYLYAKASQPGVMGEKALLMMGQISSSDQEGRDYLLEALEQASGAARPIETQTQILQALANLREPSAAPQFVHYMDSRSPSIQMAAISGLARLGSKAEPHVPKLIDTYAVSDDRTKVRIAVALGSIGGEKAVEAMEQMVSAEGIPPDLNRTLRMGLNDAKRRLKEPAGNRGGVPAAPSPALGGNRRR